MFSIEKIFEFLHIDANGLKEFKFSSKINLLNKSNFLNIQVNSTTNYYIDSKGELDSINYESLEQEDRNNLIQNILEEDHVMLIPSNIYPKLEEAKEYVKSPKNVTLSYFENKLLPDDIRILRSADFIKRLYEAGNTRDIPNLKKQLTGVYGQRANIICNLYTAGYFETFLKQKYEEMAHDINFIPKDFHDLYKSLLNDFPVAIFVSYNTSPQDIENKILDKLNRIKEAKLNYLNIHGIGEKNIITIESILSRDEIKNMIVKETTTKTANTIILRLIFNY